MTKIAIVEDMDESARYLSILLGGYNGIDIVGTYSTGHDALVGIRHTTPDIALVDIGLPDISGIEVMRVLRGELPDLDIIAYTMYEDKKHLFAALKAGACGYILKGAKAGEIVDGIAQIAKGGSPMSPKIARYVIEEFQAKNSKRDIILTPREREVLEGIAQGKQEKDLAQTLSLSPHTIHSHLKNIYKKPNTQSRAEAVFIARNKGII